MRNQNLTQMSPQEIDTILEANWLEQGRQLHRLGALNKSLAKEAIAKDENHPKRFQYIGWDFTAYRAERNVLLVDIKRLQNEAAPYEAEYTRRPWKRYFVVAGGHIHRERSCSSCYPTTVFGWLPELSGCDETEMVAKYGETACTVCFPDAPTMKGWGKVAEDKAAAEAADGVCTVKTYHDVIMNGRNYSDPSMCYPRGACTECGRNAAITKAGNLRKHKRT